MAWTDDECERWLADGEPQPGVFLPTPDDIEAACERIQGGWTDADEVNRRAGNGAVTWTPPQSKPGR